MFSITTFQSHTSKHANSWFDKISFVEDISKSRGSVHDLLVARHGKKSQYTYTECLNAYTDDSEYYYVQEER
jgi:hypothetical protein